MKVLDYQIIAIFDLDCFVILKDWSIVRLCAGIDKNAKCDDKIAIYILYGRLESRTRGFHSQTRSLCPSLFYSFTSFTDYSSKSWNYQHNCTLPKRQESYFNWLFGTKEPGLSGVINCDTGESILFIPRLPESYAVWMGPLRTPDWFVRHYGVDECFYSDEITTV